MLPLHEWEANDQIELQQMLDITDTPFLAEQMLDAAALRELLSKRW
jgi:hypothetical protein